MQHAAVAVGPLMKLRKRRSIGWELRRTERIPARLSRQPAQKDRARRREPRYILTEPWIGYRFDPVKPFSHKKDKDARKKAQDHIT